MKRLLATLNLLLLISFSSLAQAPDPRTKAIDSLVNRIDGNRSLVTTFFSTRNGIKPVHFMRYRYQTSNKQHVKIERRYADGVDSITQTFYLRDNQLVYVREQIVSHFNKTDSSMWAGYFYFSNNKLIDLSSLGHGKSEVDDWDPEGEMVAAFANVNKDLERYKKSVIISRK